MPGSGVALGPWVDDTLGGVVKEKCRDSRAIFLPHCGSDMVPGPADDPGCCVG